MKALIGNVEVVDDSIVLVSRAETTVVDIPTDDPDEAEEIAESIMVSEGAWGYIIPEISSLPFRYIN